MSVHEKEMPEIYQSIEDAVIAWVEQIGRDRLVRCIEDGRTTLDFLAEQFAESVRSELSVSGEDDHD